MRCNGEPPPEEMGGCPSCDDTGYIEIDDCPSRLVTREVRDLLRLTDQAGKGRLPVAGGVLDQTKCFLDLLAFVEAEEARLRAEKDPLGISGA